jgi:hypothetical protein
MHSPTRAQSKVKTPRRGAVDMQYARCAVQRVCTLPFVYCLDYLHVQYSSVRVGHIKGQAIPHTIQNTNVYGRGHISNVPDGSVGGDW